MLQPRVSFHLTAATRSRFAALLATSGGIDPYSTAASDAYMDLFGVGTFTGKGIYDVDAFEAATGETFPENHILSHDLIEGNYAALRAAQRHRAVRRLPGPLPRLRPPRAPMGPRRLAALALAGPRAVPTPDGATAETRCRLLERWKLLDNLRRSLVPPALLVLLVLGWTVLPGSPWLWTAVALAVFALPLFQIGAGRRRSGASAAGRCRRSEEVARERAGDVRADRRWTSSSWPIGPAAGRRDRRGRWCGCS